MQSNVDLGFDEIWKLKNSNLRKRREKKNKISFRFVRLFVSRSENQHVTVMQTILASVTAKIKIEKYNQFCRDFPMFSFVTSRIYLHTRRKRWAAETKRWDFQWISFDRRLRCGTLWSTVGTKTVHMSAIERWKLRHRNVSNTIRCVNINNKQVTSQRPLW